MANVSDHDESQDQEDAAIFRSVYPSLRKFAAATAGWEIEPDDLVQEALARTLRHHRLRDLDAPGPFLRRAILNLALDGRRHRRASRKTWPRLAEPSAVSQSVPSDLADLELVAPMDRAVLYLVYVEGLTHRESGDLLGITEQASRSRATRATAQLRQQLNSEEARHDA